MARWTSPPIVQVDGFLRGWSTAYTSPAKERLFLPPLPAPSHLILQSCPVLWHTPLFPWKQEKTFSTHTQYWHGKALLGMFLPYPWFRTPFSPFTAYTTSYNWDFQRFVKSPLLSWNRSETWANKLWQLYEVMDFTELFWDFSFACLYKHRDASSHCVYEASLTLCLPRAMGTSSYLLIAFFTLIFQHF